MFLTKLSISMNLTVKHFVQYSLLSCYLFNYLITQEISKGRSEFEYQSTDISDVSILASFSTICLSMSFLPLCVLVDHAF